MEWVLVAAVGFGFMAVLSQLMAIHAQLGLMTQHVAYVARIAQNYAPSDPDYGE